MSFLTDPTQLSNDEKNYQELTFICLLCSNIGYATKGFSLLERITALNEDERRVLTDILDFVLQGLEKGREIYGPMNLLTDDRDLELEAREEMRDGLVYETAAKLKKSKLLVK